MVALVAPRAVLAEVRWCRQRSSNTLNAGYEEWFYRHAIGASPGRPLIHEITGPRRANRSSSARLLLLREITGPRRANRSSSARLLLLYEIAGPRRANNRSSSARLLLHEITAPRRANRSSSARLLPLYEITGPRRANSPRRPGCCLCMK